ncbi:MAG: type II toxin-antitoxin system RelE/ParE family toxin [Kiritimatiellae bacterium]|nr:type II toxin-antitoxin system RelE/ParE family toxin [Kiritimatiellia bacterium]
MKIVWSLTAIRQLDEIYDTIASECDNATAKKWFFKISSTVDVLVDFPFAGPSIPECAFEEHFTEFIGLRQLVVKPYRVIYEVTDEACNILGVMRTCRLIALASLSPSGKA